MKKLILITLFFLSLSEAQANGYKVIAGGGNNNPSVWEYCIDGVVYFGYTYNNTAGAFTPKLLPDGKIKTCS